MKFSMKPVRPCTLKPPTTLPPLHNRCVTTRPPLSSRTILSMQIQVPIMNRRSSSSDDGGGLSLSQRWMDYQGIKNWEGLLDPLDDTLREEIIRYGSFVEAAYRSYEFDPASPGYSHCRHSKAKLLSRAGFPATGYRVSRNLSATSGIQLPRWAEKTPEWMSVQSSWIGFVAVCQDKREIERLGRRDVVIALRGTATCLEWLENLRATLTPLPAAAAAVGGGGDYECGPMVESGFLSLYTSSVGSSQSLQSSIRDEISRILKVYGDEPLSITISGHSLGAALAILTAYDIKQTFQNLPHVTVMSFGGPRVGNPSFRCHLERQGTKVLRIVNSDDPITKVPGFVIDNDDTDTDNNVRINNIEARYMANISGWFQKLVEDTQWVYADVGCELRLSSRDSPSHSGISIAACHDLRTYLDLVSGFVSSNCPIRATARKIISCGS
ncbi:PREDICTED: phospholipase A(1) DAD1, chloroplastic-like [Ipomoea nil]|uniref:phospholipase A(1) DAD1, chloroplastic-like n=1 Tax=Ipomoea nil TaxID=35883 RepID=UPI0009017D23|nr:PREDICTED: phospholipase A(1) DAD1, chloroplastic-like [Ipomoea nil]